VTDPRPPRPTEPAEGDPAPGRETDRRTPRTEEPAEGKDLDDGGDIPQTD
jgi:hypothetical protein